MREAIAQAARDLVMQAAQQAIDGKPSLMNALLDYGKPRLYEVRLIVTDERGAEKRGPTEVTEEPTPRENPPAVN